jgi:hypothetical protein
MMDARSQCSRTRAVREGLALHSRSASPLSQATKGDGSMAGQPQQDLETLRKNLSELKAASDLVGKAGDAIGVAGDMDPQGAAVLARSMQVQRLLEDMIATSLEVVRLTEKLESQKAELQQLTTGTRKDG